MDFIDASSDDLCMGSTGVRVAVIAVVALCLLVIGYLVWGSLRSSDSDAVGDLPTVAEIVAAQAHQHGVSLPPMTEEQAAQLSAPPSTVSSLSPYDQVLVQLDAVKSAAGLDEALAILADVARESDVVAAECDRLYAALVDGATAPRAMAEVCRA